jgi:transposase
MVDDTIGSESSATTILALDLGKFKSVACVYEPASGTHRFQTIATSPAAVHDLLVASAPSRLVIEACSIAGWVADLARTLCIHLQVANVTAEAWKWQRVKQDGSR